VLEVAQKTIYFEVETPAISKAFRKIIGSASLDSLQNHPPANTVNYVYQPEVAGATLAVHARLAGTNPHRRR
jgi:hypothetical protein